jgi:hypothetical protein
MLILTRNIGQSIMVGYDTLVKMHSSPNWHKCALGCRYRSVKKEGIERWLEASKRNHKD